MKKTVVVMSSNREMEEGTRETLKALSAAGAARVLERGSSDVAFARCRALSFACDALRAELHDRDVVLMLDDDMDVPLETAQAVVDAARSSGVACAAAYATVTAKLAASRWPGHPGLWVVGLGCVAIPAALLLDLEKRSDSFEVSGRVYTAFTWAGATGGEWVAEDYRLSMQLGGVKLLPLGVGHIKKWTLWPDANTLEQIANYEQVKP